MSDLNLSGSLSPLNIKNLEIGMNEIYQYSRLTQPDSIRLVVVQPSSDLAAPLQASLLHTSLAECENDLVDHYTALSYVWGDQADQCTINVDGKKINITVSLDEALRHIRQPDRPLRIWADGLCINQRDTEERNQQVRQMGKIYEHATHTIIFLGPSGRHTDFLLDMLKSLKAPRARARNRSFLEQVREFSRGEFKSLTEDILARPWFRRVWVLQELVLSSNPWVQCGIMRIKWNLLCDHLLPRYSTTHWTEEFNQFLRPLADMDEARSKFRIMSATKTMEDSRISRNLLWDLLTSRRGHGVLDPRDMVYAHLGLMNIHIQNSFAIDYSISVSQLFEDIAARFIRWHENLTILMHVGDTRVASRNKNLPSWVPDWSCPFVEKEKLSTKVSAPDPLSKSYFSNMSSDQQTRSSATCMYSLACPHILALVGYNFGSVRAIVSQTAISESSHQAGKISSPLVSDLIAVKQMPIDPTMTRALECTALAFAKEMYRSEYGILAFPERLEGGDANSETIGIIVRMLEKYPRKLETRLAHTSFPFESPLREENIVRELRKRIGSSPRLDWGGPLNIQAMSIGEALFGVLCCCSHWYLEGETVAFLSDGMIARVPLQTQEGDCISVFIGGEQNFLLRPVSGLLNPRNLDTAIIADVSRAIRDLGEEASVDALSLSKVGHYNYISPVPMSPYNSEDNTLREYVRARWSTLLQIFALH